MLSVSLIVGFAFLLEACFGFGSGIIATPFLSFLMLPKDAIYLMLVFQCLKVVLLIPAWRHISWKSIRLLPAGMFVGIIVGVCILDIVSPTLFRLGLAAYLVAFVISDCVEARFVKRTWLESWAGSLLAGFSGGIVSGVIGMGGPPYVAYLRSTDLDKLAFRATIILVVSIGNYFRLFLEASEIVLNKAVLENFLPCLVAFIIASIVGVNLPRFLSEKAFKTAINIMLMGASVLLVYKSLV